MRVYALVSKWRRRASLYACAYAVWKHQQKRRETTHTHITNNKMVALAGKQREREMARCA